MIREDYLVTINSRSKVQQVHLRLNQITSYFEIYRTTGQYAGKQTVQPTITIESGKVKRTPIQQAELEYNSHLKKYLDKGYVKLSDLTKIPFEKLSESDLKGLIGVESKSDQNGIPKPMLAVQSEKCTPNAFEKVWMVSRKLDGVRNITYWKDNEVHTASRGGGEYDIPTTQIRTNEKLVAWFKKNPTLMLDGELYHHGISLQKLSGIARLKEWESRCEILEYWIYDVVSSDPFSDRYEILMSLQEFLGEETKVRVIDHYKLSGWLTIKKKHDLFVSEGYEGLVMRNPDKEYGVGKRSSSYMIKLKDYKDDTFLVVGWEPGLRPVEDMCFICETKDEKQFKAKPMGDRATKEEYIENIDSLIGQKADVKFFMYSDDGVPVQTVFKAFRYDI